ncbi:hypothetical protein [Thermococcus sp. MV11]|uniref:hypothetical protein n=1 Tax=Thermococcus sp. MV11 TaxID=1638267 RepID=UPI0014309814|nr:hypothetical protein [Thermococcus sp. MV11]NJE02803.1 hypothetical protein [Thermococcus sp. MV11]
MLDAYLKNGELFLREEEIQEINEETVKEHYLLPLREMVVNLVPVDSESDAIAVLRAFGFSLPKSDSKVKILQALTGEKASSGVCSICGRKTKVVSNKSYIFPFERKVDSVVNEGNRLHFCMEHAFKLYSAMAYLYTVPIRKSQTGDWLALRFFFDAPEEQLLEMNRVFHDFWADRLEIEEKRGKRTAYSVKVRLELSKYHPNEAFFAILHSFVKHLRDVDMLEETEKLAESVDVHVFHGAGQFYGYRTLRGSTFERLIRFVDSIQRTGRATRWGDRHLQSLDSAVVMFYESLGIPRGKRDRSKDYLERERFFEGLLSGNFDFVLLNRIFMERVRHDLPLPPYYYTWAHSYLEAFGGGVVDLKTFEQVNGLGYSLGKKMKGTNLERYQWELFRARGFEEFLNKLVELQAKLEESLDLRPIYENEREWKVVKAILLNGMLNALHGADRKSAPDNSKEGGE